MIVGVVRGLVIGNRFVAVGFLLVFATVAERSATSTVRVDREQRQNPFEILGVTGRAGRRTRAANQRLEAMMARTAFVFVKWH